MAVGTSTSGDFSAGVSDIFAYFGTEAKAAGDRAEQQEYGLANTLALQNKQFTEQSTAIKEAQESREINKSLGTTTADVAGAGFAQSGSALALLRDSASQGALTKAVTSEQGLITEAGYQEQANSYALMASAASSAADAETKAGEGDLIAAGIQIAGGIASFGTGAFGGGDLGNSSIGNPTQIGALY